MRHERTESEKKAFDDALRTGKPTIEAIEIRRIQDVDADTSDLGRYTDKPEEWAIERASGEYVHDLPKSHEPPPKGREYRYFVPDNTGEEPRSRNFKKYGRQNYKRAEDYNRGEWSMLGITTKARILVPDKFNKYCMTQRITGGSSWGIESDSEESYMEETARECLSELEDQLASFGFSPEAIKAAIPATIEFKD